MIKNFSNTFYACSFELFRIAFAFQFFWLDHADWMKPSSSFTGDATTQLDVTADLTVLIELIIE